jgi:hypothetical protein
MTIKKEEIEKNDLKKEEQFFHLPISFLDDKCELEKHIITDLELKAEDITQTSLYDYVFLPQKDSFGEKTIGLWSQYYTANKEFITDSQKLLEKRNEKEEHIRSEQEEHIRIEETKAVFDIWHEIQEETGFIYKYQYIEYERFEQFNNNPAFLQCLSIFNMTSPVLSLLVPIFFLIIPLLLLKIQGVPLSTEVYITTLKMVFQKHHIGQLFNLKSASIDKVVYILISFVFYLFQIYQNIMACIKFFRNMHKIHHQLFTIRDYLVTTLEKMDTLEKQSADLKTYRPFLQVLREKAAVMREMVKEYDEIIPFKTLFSLKKVAQVGHIMKCFYQLYNKSEYHAILQYSFGLNGYLENLEGLQVNIQAKNVGMWQAQQQQQQKKKQKKAKEKKAKDDIKADATFTNAYFPTLVNANPVKNTYELKKHMLITGPNAAGKTTLLKTTLFNIIVTQQTGFGFYDYAAFEPYDMIHCYINIPDTSGRDSLFQAEARRCKEILDQIDCRQNNNNNNKAKRHFCVFDELYSGTNPYEAIGSAYAFLTYLNTFSNVNFVLTTHFLDLCKRLEESNEIKNYQMRINTDDAENFKYTYELTKGISHIKGGVKVLKDLHYPPEIIRVMQKVLKDIVI